MANKYVSIFIFSILLLTGCSSKFYTFTHPRDIIIENGILNIEIHGTWVNSITNTKPYNILIYIISTRQNQELEILSATIKNKSGNLIYDLSNKKITAFEYDSYYTLMKKDGEKWYLGSISFENLDLEHETHAFNITVLNSNNTKEDIQFILKPKYKEEPIPLYAWFGINR